VETARVALIRYISQSGRNSVGSGLLVTDRVVLTSNVVGEGSQHRVECAGKTRLVARVLRSETVEVDLATLTLSEPVTGLGRLGYARVDRTRVGFIDNCLTVGFPQWKKSGDRRISAQVYGRVPTAEGLEATADSELRIGYLTFVADRELSAPQIPAGMLADTPSSPWAGMSGAAVLAGELVLGVVRSHNLAEGGQSLTVTPLTAIDSLPHEIRERFWAALGVADSNLLPMVSATGPSEAQAGSMPSDSSGPPEDEAQPAGTSRLIVPAITDDAIEGHPDRLGVDADARALAALVASRGLEPPLAIGLYGEWGSGKTFFMKRVQAYVEDLTRSGATDDFCSEIAPVWFSAWHYARGNLWASLLHHVFASLYPAKSRHQLAFDELMARVQGAQQVTSALAAQTEAATMRLDGATEAIDAAKERHQIALQESSNLRTKDLWDAVKITAADQHLKDQVVSAADDLGLSVATDSAQDLVNATRQVVDLASRTRVLATSGRWYRSPLAYACYAAVIVGILGLLLGAVVRSAHEWMGTAITAISQLAAVGSAAAAWTVRQGGLARRFIAPAETLQRRLEQRLAEQKVRNERELAALQEEADTAKAELAVALQQHAAAEQELATAEKEQTELTGKRLLRRYLAERASSGDYEHYMGVVALAHRDLRDLEEYLRAAISDVSGEEQGLDRIILYIDDLDRCDPNAVADVLDAVHLLLALRLFVVIVGVDPRWLKRSLRERHPILLETTSSAVTWTSPADYLEKIFQLTYTLPHMSPSSCADLLAAAAQDTQISSARQDKLRFESTIWDPESGTRDDIEDNADTPSEDRGQSSRISPENLAEAMTLREGDIEALRKVAPLVSTSPRRAKRFLSIYLVIRARAQGDPVLGRSLDGNGDAPASVSDSSLLVLVALLMGLPKTIAASIQDEPHSETNRQTTLAASLTKADTEPEEQGRLQEFLASWPSIATLPMDAFLQWLPLVRPYLPLDLDELRYSGPVDASH
jgi:KAP family P-loop domain